MPEVRSKTALAKAYQATAELIKRREVPTDLIFPDRTLFRQIDPTSPHSTLTRPAVGGHVSKIEGYRLFTPVDGKVSANAAIDEIINKNRFSGFSHNADIPASAALYFAIQQQALMNETAHYRGNALLDGRCVLQVRVMGTMLVMDLSPHNPGARRFFDRLGSDTWKQVNDPDDCSVSRGIGLAAAHSGFLRGLLVRTVRSSSPSAFRSGASMASSSGERGDNLLLFANPGQQVSGIALESATFYDKGKEPISFKAAFP